MADDRRGPEPGAGALPGDDAIPSHSRGEPAHQPQPSSSPGPTPPPPRHAAPVNRAYVEALLEGVPLPATRGDVVRHAERAGEKGLAAVLARELPGRRFSSIDEVGEALAPVQPAWAPQRRVPRPESDLPPGGPGYGRSAQKTTS